MYSALLPAALLSCKFLGSRVYDRSIGLQPTIDAAVRRISRYVAIAVEPRELLTYFSDFGLGCARANRYYFSTYAIPLYHTRLQYNDWHDNYTYVIFPPRTYRCYPLYVYILSYIVYYYYCTYAIYA